MPDEVKPIIDQSVQSRAASDASDTGGISVLSWLAIYNSLIAPWWSERRDRQLSQFWRQEDSIASAVYTLLTKLTSIPFTIQPRDNTVKSHQRQAEEYQYNLEYMTDFGAGWVTGMQKAYQDLFTQDKGLFLEVIGEGAKDQPISGSALGIAPIDAQCCLLTNSPIYPVIYHDPDGTRYKMHYTRVMHMAQMPSGRAEMNGIGYCALSRCLSAATNLYDLAVYKQEKLGSRPKRQIIVGRSGVTAEQIRLAFKAADEQMDNEGLARFAKSVVIAPKQALPGHEIALEMIDLASVPDGFDERTSTELAWWVMAWAFGVDAREFIPATVSGATKADAMVQHMKARGKAVGNTLEQITQLINRYYLPAHLQIVFDVQDDDEDQQKAEIRSTRSETREKNLGDGVTTVRVEREKMLEDGEISREQFIQLELEEGRLESGDEAIILWQNPDYADLLDIGVTDPLDTTLHTWEELKPLVMMRKLANYLLIATVAQAKRKQQAREANAALDALKDYYDKQITPPTPPQQVVVAPTLPAMPQEEVIDESDISGEEENTSEGGAENEVQPPFEKSADEYAAEITRLANALYYQRINSYTFVDSLFSAAKIHLWRAWAQAAARFGVKSEDMSPDERAYIDTVVNNEALYMPGLADFIIAQRGKGVDSLMARLSLWVNRWNDVYNAGLLRFGRDKKLKWVMGATVEHCEDCAKYAGKVYRSSTWARYDIRPQSRLLACGGRKCRCRFVVTRSPITPGKPSLPLGA